MRLNQYRVNFVGMPDDAPTFDKRKVLGRCDKDKLKVFIFDGT